MRSPIDKAATHEVIWNQVAPLFKAARSLRGAEFVYLIGEADGPMKIGSSKDPIARLRNMQTGNPRRLRVEHVLLGSVVLERLLHELWEPFAIVSARSASKVGAAPGTEWFQPSVRPLLCAVVEEAARRQIDHLESMHVLAIEDMEAIVRGAHAESGLTARGRDVVRLLAANAGHVLGSRGSRI